MMMKIGDDLSERERGNLSMVILELYEEEKKPQSNVIRLLEI